jgi:hypothetical protein
MSDDVGCGPAVGIVEIRTSKCCVEVDEVCDVTEAVICEELCEFAVDASVFDAGFDVLHVFVAEDLPDVLALDSFPVNLIEIGVGEVIVVVPDAVVVDVGEVVDFPVRKNVLVIPEFGFVLVGGRECDIDVVLKEGLCAWQEVSVTTIIDVAGPVQQVPAVEPSSVVGEETIDAAVVTPLKETLVEINRVLIVPVAASEQHLSFWPVSQVLSIGEADGEEFEVLGVVRALRRLFERARGFNIEDKRTHLNKPPDVTRVGQYHVCCGRRFEVQYFRDEKFRPQSNR